MDILRAAIEIFIIFIFFYYLLFSMRGTLGAGIFKGLIFVSVITFLLMTMATHYFELDIINYILKEWFLPVLIFALIIIFHPELRRALLRLGQSRLFNPFFQGKFKIITETIEAVLSLSRERVGTLIAIERDVGLKPYIEGGVRLDAEVTSELIQTISHPGSALHDGAIIIKEERIIAAGCLFPLTDNPDVAKSMGTRHRAAIGITEESDAITIIVSEETGQISLGVKGQLTRDVDKDTLKNILEGLYLKEEKILPAPEGTKTSV